MTPKIHNYWQQCQQAVGHQHELPDLPRDAFHFCDNEADANQCARLVVKGIKRATCCSIAELEFENEPIPKPGDVHVVTDWHGQPVAVIRTTKVDVVRYCDITEEQAAIEGEGDGSLEYWRKGHEAYYRRILSGTDHEFHPEMMVAFEQFEVIYSC